MVDRFKLLLFHYEIYYGLLNFTELTDSNNRYLYRYLVNQVKSEILNYIENNKTRFIYINYLNKINKKIEKNNFYYNELKKKEKYENYFSFLMNDPIAYKKYTIAKNKLINNYPLDNNIYYKKNNTNNGWYYEFINNLFTYKSTLFILGFIIFITFIFNIISNTSVLENSISEHGMISNMVDLHSSFAIIVKLLVTLNFFFCFILFVLWIGIINQVDYKTIFKNKIPLDLGQFYFALYIVNLLYSLYFVFTGFVWAEFTWGGKIWKFESKMIQLWIHIFLNLLFCYIFFFHRKGSFFYILNLIFITSIVSFVFFYIYGNMEQAYSIHQNTDSLHLFLRFVGAGTSYYVIIFVIFLFYLVFTYLAMQYEYSKLIIKDSVLQFYSKFIY